MTEDLKSFCDKHTPIKKKYKRGNQMPFVTIDLSKAIMEKSKLRNNYLKNKTNANRMLNKETTAYPF